MMSGKVFTIAQIGFDNDKGVDVASAVLGQPSWLGGGGDT